MNDYEQYFNWLEVHLHHFYIYFVFAAIIAFYLIIKSDSKHKFELFFISFYLLTGNINELLTIKIPGFSFFEIQPIRFIYLMLSVFIIRKTLLSRKRQHFSFDRKVPWFMVLLYTFVTLLIVSVVANISHMGVPEALKIILDTLAFMVILVALQLMADKPTYDVIGKSIIICAIITTLISFIQISFDPYFLRIGDDRLAFGRLLRTNGLFMAEYNNSYYLIIAIAWTLVTIKNNLLKIALVCLFSLGVISTFMRMSWIILFMVLVTYLVYINKVAIEKLLLVGLTGLAILLSLSIFYYPDIMNSSVVKERLGDDVEGRKGYYTMVIDNIGKKPLFGYGDLRNEVYYTNMLRITGSRERATAETGGLHSGYFSALFLYGIPAFICFVLFVLLSVFYYARSYKENIYFVIPFLISIIYMIGNLTNTFLFQSYLSVLFAIHIGIGMGINKTNKIQLLRPK